jgi:hypothetical protein
MPRCAALGVASPVLLRWGFPFLKNQLFCCAGKRHRDIKMVPTLLHGHTTHCLPLRYVTWPMCSCYVCCSKSS